MKYESEGEGRASRITVTDNHPDAAVVETLRKVLAVEKRLQDASWKHCEGERLEIMKKFLLGVIPIMLYRYHSCSDYRMH